MESVRRSGRGPVTAPQHPQKRPDNLIGQPPIINLHNPRRRRLNHHNRTAPARALQTDRRPVLRSDSILHQLDAVRPPASHVTADQTGRLQLLHDHAQGLGALMPSQFPHLGHHQPIRMVDPTARCHQNAEHLHPLRSERISLVRSSLWHDLSVNHRRLLGHGPL